MIFKQMRWKNFLSYGKSWTEIDLDQKKLIGIFGKNGSGKSIIIDALSFVTTGKVFRNKVKKSQIINSRNKKNCLVELYLSRGKDNYIIKRGIKPDVFEIIKNDVSLDETAHVKDFQTILEQIFCFNPKILNNTLFMSSMAYKPFLQFSAAEKREYTEDILSLQIFGDMLNNLKIDLSINKKEILEIKQNHALIEKEINTIQKMNELIKNKQNANKSEIDSQISELEEKIKNLSLNLQKIDKILQSDQTIYDKNQKKYVTGVNKNCNKQQDINSKISLLESDVNRGKEDINKENTLKEFFKIHTKCNTCKQEITEKHKKQIVVDINKRIATVEKQINEIIEVINNHKKNIENIQNIRKKIDNFGNKNQEFYEKKISPQNKKINSLKSDIYSSKNLIESHQRSLKELKSEDVLKDVSKKIEKKKLTENKLYIKEEEEKVISLSKNLLSDKGIKLFIINKYIPLLNKYVNEFLDVMGASYRIKFNKELQEKIVSRGYENLSYWNFSSGEMQRCDLALLFAFLKIAKNKNSFDSNILILDEIIGNSLDSEGIKGVMSILQKFKDDGKTIFIISHMESIRQMIDKSLYAYKKIYSKLIGG